MLARFQQIISLTLIAVAGTWVFAFVNAGHPHWAWFGPMLILLSHALLVGFEFGCLVVSQRHRPGSSATFRQLFWAWWSEVCAAASVFFWRQPFRTNVEPDNLSAEPGDRRAVVFVHGFFCNRGFWTPWLRRLRMRDVPFVAVNLEPLFGSVDRYAQVIEEAVKKLETATGLTPVMVGHSMGGLAIRAWLCAFAADSRVHRVVTIASPHHGTWLAQWSHTVSGKQMRLRSRWLQRLEAREPAWRYARFTCFYGNCDNIVFPAMTATLLGADNRHVPATAHVRMAFQCVVFDEVCRWLAVPGGAAK